MRHVVAGWNRGRREPIAARMDRYTSPEPMSGCWLWSGQSDKDGYGSLGKSPWESCVRRNGCQRGVTEEERLKAHLGDALGEAVFEKACQIWADRVPWARALEQAEAQFKDRAPRPTALPRRRGRP